ncbi:MAG: TRAP transporter small permease [Nitrospinae bacterium]|nr:TRAP transporter small permease [Nitrospinota bacterium]
MRSIKSIDNALAKIEAASIVALLSLMIAFSFGQAILRNLFHEGILWADILLRQLVLWVGFLGASLAVREGRHISISILPNILPKSWKRRLAVLVDLAAGIISAVMAWAAWNFVRHESESGSVLFLDIPVWTFQAVLPYSFCVIAVRYLLLALENALSGREPS